MALLPTIDKGPMEDKEAGIRTSVHEWIRNISNMEFNNVGHVRHIDIPTITDSLQPRKIIIAFFFFTWTIQQTVIRPIETTLSKISTKNTRFLEAVHQHLQVANYHYNNVHYSNEIGMNSFSNSKKFRPELDTFHCQIQCTCLICPWHC